MVIIEEVMHLTLFTILISYGASTESVFKHSLYEMKNHISTFIIFVHEAANVSKLFWFLAPKCLI